MARAAEQVDTATEAVAMGMGYWTERDLPFYYGLARAFPLADHWFSSCLGPTFPNRRFLIADTAHGLIDDSPYDLLDCGMDKALLTLRDQAAGPVLLLLVALGLLIFGVYGLCEARWRKV